METQESYPSGYGSVDENSTHIKLMSFGCQPSPSMETGGIDLAQKRKLEAIPNSTTLPQPNQVSSHFGLAERQESFRTIPSECSNLESLPNNRDICRTRSAHAEHQVSFRTLTSESPNLQSLPIGPGGQPISTALLATSKAGAFDTGFNIVASIENNEAANPTSARLSSPLHSSSDNGDVQHNTVSSSSGRNLNTSQNSNDSRASRSGNYRQRIDENTLIHELPLPFINFLSSCFDRQDCKNWKDLVDLYNWNYKKITVFKNKNHPDGIFCSLLNEHEFQQYTIDQLKKDLEDIPRKDALEDLNKMIYDYNAEL